MIEYACKKCHALSTERKCKCCGSTEVSTNWSGVIIVLDPSKSKIAELLKLRAPGEFAINVE
ncbi:MAG: transcription elongation factor subunit Spt4 [Candidatus Nanoarchaeia archaeon]|nr:DNA-directed RNA polymerase subunit E'' [Candidatus Haiyanarchaeum thermophilum]MCW1302962.1 DNA-directed RNA polymerase subunit E'' [Candidatus Haiyanarchaeum thermophilum]MCW1303640.1 DNA-directed RNA polymerase subunit E'' [Candidatus Haiyanarchaeum thermophilum]MCW1306321.1 DNA-directed RNA polymerase subunit E'' [Candidatus Haiyanarchaeum thermophilum]MCW1307169.1 DNA-directed RNA polymerase subunit E'' [Candidatus Haiyanarchaeum thermophilum]